MWLFCQLGLMSLPGPSWWTLAKPEATSNLQASGTLIGLSLSHTHTIYAHLIKWARFCTFSHGPRMWPQGFHIFFGCYSPASQVAVLTSRWHGHVSVKTKQHMPLSFHKAYPCTKSCLWGTLVYDPVSGTQAGPTRSKFSHKPCSNIDIHPIQHRKRGNRLLSLRSKQWCRKIALKQISREISAEIGSVLLRAMSRVVDRLRRMICMLIITDRFLCSNPLRDLKQVSTQCFHVIK
jgi:hypothetical protein